MKFFLLLICSILLSACAQIVPLNGGPEDEKAPEVKECTPLNGSTNFNSNEVKIKFDEYIQLKDIFNQLIVTPQMKEQPEVTVNGKNLNIKFKEELKPNTTYKLFFGSSICDITEGNPYVGYEYTFSTGSYIDTLKYTGVAYDSYTLQPVKDAWGMLYADMDDSIVFKSKPDYLARTGPDGKFTITHLPTGKFKLFVLSDKNKNYQYDIGEAIGFASSPVELPDTNSNAVFMFTEKPNKTYISKTEHGSPEKIRLLFNTSPEKLNSIIVKDTKGKEMHQFTKSVSGNMDTLTLYFPKPENDSLFIYTTFNDTITDSSTVLFQTEVSMRKQFERKRFPYEIRLLNGGTLPYNTTVLNLFSSFITQKINADSLILTENGNELESGATDIKLYNADSIGIYYKLKEEAEYKLKLLPGFAYDYYNRTNDTLLFSFKTTSKSDYGTLYLSLNGLDEGNYVIEVLDQSLKVNYRKSFFMDKKETDEQSVKITFKDVLPGNYKARIIIDTNNDKDFSGGSYLKKKQAETVIIYNGVIKVVSDWENEFSWDIKK